MIRNESGFTGKLMTLLTAAHKMLERCWGGYIKKNIPIDKSVVLFNSKPDFADNARALAEYMLANGYTKKYKIFFDVDNLSKYKDSVKGITFVGNGGLVSLTIGISNSPSKNAVSTSSGLNPSSILLLTFAI